MCVVAVVIVVAVVCAVAVVVSRIVIGMSVECCRRTYVEGNKKDSVKFFESDLPAQSGAKKK